MSMYGEEGRYKPRVYDGPGRTKQSMKEECDVNNIVARFDLTGLLDHLAEGVPVYEDVSELGDYRTALDNVRAAQEYFDGFPAAVRAEFGNDVARFMTYLSGASEADLRKLGLDVLERRGSPRSPDTRKGDVPVVVEAPPAEPEEPRTVPT